MWLDDTQKGSVFCNQYITNESHQNRLPHSVMAFQIIPDTCQLLSVSLHG